MLLAGASPGEIALGAAALSGLCAASLWFRHWRAAVCCVGVALFCTIIVREISTSTCDGIVTIDAWLTVCGDDARCLPITVAPVPGRLGGRDEMPWERIPQDDATCAVFAGPIEAMVYERINALRSSISWTYFAQIPVVVRVGDQEFAFLPDDLFDAPHSGPPPKKIAGSIDVDDYLHGTKHSRPLAQLDVLHAMR